MRGRKRLSDIFNLPPDDYLTAAENLIHEAFCAEHGSKKGFFFSTNPSAVRGEIVFCFLCVGDEGSAVQPFCCGSGREEEQTG